VADVDRRSPIVVRRVDCRVELEVDGSAAVLVGLVEEVLNLMF
jgi:hypothetical protein